MVGRGAGLLGQIHRLWDLGTFAGLTDAQLLARFADRSEDDADIAFEALVERHGPMVFRVCRGVLRDEHAAEDAFQATFLVLAKKARSLWVKDSLASWLHGVAHRVASRARSDAARRCRHELRLAEARGPALEMMPDHPRPEAWAILSEEIAQLPETYRAPVVLCYLEAMSYQAAAASLGVTEDTVRGRLARARERLRKSLARRGVEVPAIVAAAQPAIPAVVIRPGLAQATARAAVGLSAGGAASLEVISLSAISLCERTCRTMMLTKLKAAAAALVLGVITAGAIVSAQPTGGGRTEPLEPARKAPRPPQPVAARGGNMIVDWIPADGKGGKKEITVDPTKHCIYMPGMKSLTADERPNDGVLMISLERGKTYKVTAAGEAFMTDSTGNDADPFAGVVLFYGTDEEDCYAIRQTVLAPGKSVTFRSPWNIAPTPGGSGVYLQAFFLDPAPNDPNRGSYTLTIEETGEQAAAEHTVKAPFDGIITNRGRPMIKHIYNRNLQSVNIDRSHTATDTAPPDHPDTKARDQAKPKP
jgi:RNA polymerase sigma factor (sigma-70 family)